MTVTVPVSLPPLKAFSLSLAAGSADLLNTSNEADRPADVLRQHSAVNSWFRDIQYARHLQCLLCGVTEDGTMQYRAGNV